MVHPQEHATPEQRATLARMRPDEPMHWMVIYQDGRTALPHLDRAGAELYAARNHAIVLPLVVPAWALAVAG